GGQCRIFRAADANRSQQWISAANHKLIHVARLPFARCRLRPLVAPQPLSAISWFLPSRSRPPCCSSLFQGQSAPCKSELQHGGRDRDGKNQDIADRG